MPLSCSRCAAPGVRCHKMSVYSHVSHIFVMSRRTAVCSPTPFNRQCPSYRFCLAREAGPSSQGTLGSVTAAARVPRPRRGLLPDLWGLCRPELVHCFSGIWEPLHTSYMANKCHFPLGFASLQPPLPRDRNPQNSRDAQEIVPLPTQVCVDATRVLLKNYSI